MFSVYTLPFHWNELSDCPSAKNLLLGFWGYRKSELLHAITTSLPGHQSGSTVASTVFGDGGRPCGSHCDHVAVAVTEASVLRQRLRRQPEEMPPGHGTPGDVKVHHENTMKTGIFMYI